MNLWIQRLASLKVAVALLVVLCVALAVGTIVEARGGTDLASRSVYGAPWFRLLLAAFAVNVACSILVRWPWGLQRVGFVLTHGALLIILAGAVITEAFKVEGRLALWEGEKASAFSTADGGTVPLSFSVQLDAFEIDTYPGTERPAMFRSRVVVRDSTSGAPLPAVIEMNRELAYGGYRFFQSSYHRVPGRDQTILSVSKDPGQPIVFLGYFVLLGGMITVLATRFAASRAIPAVLPHTVAKAARRVAALGAVLALAAAAGIRAAPIPDRSTVELLRRLPVQHDGRVMPLDTVAREAVWNVTGRSRWEGIDPVGTVLGLSFHRQEWAAEPLVKLGGTELAAACGVAAKDGRASFSTLVENRCVLDLIERARQDAERDRPLAGALAQARELEGRLVVMQGFLRGTSYRVVPDLSNPGGPWGAADVRGGPSALFTFLDNPSPAYPPRGALEQEIVYNQIRPSRLSWWILAAAAVGSLAAARVRRRWLDVTSVCALAAGFVVMTWGIGTRWAIAGRIPASNMYESLLFLGWGVALFALAALAFLRNRLVVQNAAAMSAVTMALADLLPLDPFIHPVQPVLAGTAWLAIHVPIIMVSYSVLALGVLVAHMQVGLAIFAPSRKDLAGRMSDLLYWYTHIGAILLVAGILTGSMWAASSWGRYWGWDPKEVWSLVAFLAYVAILHGRLDRWLGPFGVAVASIVAFWTIVMTYVGVNFVLASGLHSYGFGSSAVVRWMVAVGALDMLFLGVAGAMHLSGRRRRPSFPTPSAA